MKNIDTKSNQDFRSMSTEEKILVISSGYQVPERISKEKAFEKLMESIDAEEKPVIKMKPNYFAYLALAASIVLLFGLFYSYFTNQITTISASNAKFLAYTLPDGSQINLNSGSEITFKKYGFASNRQINLNGEAFFQIKKGKRFEILTLNGKVTILGTSLNIYSREKDFKVSCATGKVKVQTTNSEVIITPGESVHLVRNRLEKTSKENIENMALWQKGNFNFENTPLSSIFGEIERQFDVKIDGSKQGERLYSGGFSNNSLNEALELVCIPMSLKYEIRPDKTVIIYKPAK